MEFDKRRPIYEQVIEYFQVSFVRGDYQPGQALPSRRDLAQTLNVNPNTIQRAFKEMEEQALIITKPNTPSCLSSDPGVIDQLREQIIRASVKDFYQKMTSLDIDMPKIISYLQDMDKLAKEESHA